MDGYDTAALARISSCESIIRDLKSLKPVWVGVNDDDTDTDAQIKSLIKKYEEHKSNAERELD